MFLISAISVATKLGTRRQRATVPITPSPKISARIVLIINPTAYPANPTTVCAEVADERRFVGADSLAIIISTSFVE